MSFINYTPQSIRNKERPVKDGSDPLKLQKKRKYNQVSRALLTGKLPINLPDAQSSTLLPDPYTLRPFRFHLIPTQYATIHHPNTLHPPSITVTSYGLENFPKLLQILSQLGRHYGALKLHLPPLESGNPWYHVPSSKPLSTIRLNVRQQVFEELECNAPNGSKAYRVAFLTKKKPMSLWHSHMVKKEDFEYIGTMQEFWAQVAKEVEEKGGSQNRFYGVDTETHLVCMEQSRTSLFDDEFNLLLTPGLTFIPGITTPYVYFGQPGTAFSWHVEDYHCHSANTLLDGAPKIWHVIPGHSMHRFVAQAKAIIPELTLTTCPQALRHEGFVLSAPPLTPEDWEKCGYPCHQFTQEKGDMMVLFPGAYHSGINNGWNLAEAMNFATEDWIEEGRKYQPCDCENAPTEPIVLDLDLIQDTVEGKKMGKGKAKAKGGAQDEIKSEEYVLDDEE